MKNVEHLKDFQVIELRRYTIKPGEREHFAQYFEAYFPEAFQQLGAIAVGQFSERNNPLEFTWMRGFHDMDDRAKINAAFYYGPLWKEHKATLNPMMTDSDNVLLLRPLSPERTVMILPAVDPVTEPAGATGVVVAEIFSVEPDSIDAFSQRAESNSPPTAMPACGKWECWSRLKLPIASLNFPSAPTDLTWYGWASSKTTKSWKLDSIH
jgi:hypothetical protein